MPELSRPSEEHLGAYFEGEVRGMQGSEKEHKFLGENVFAQNPTASVKNRTYIP